MSATVKTVWDFRLGVVERKIEKYRNAPPNTKEAAQARDELPRLYIKRDRLQKRQFEASLKRRAARLAKAGK